MFIIHIRHGPIMSTNKMSISCHPVPLAEQTNLSVSWDSNVMSMWWIISYHIQKLFSKPAWFCVIRLHQHKPYNALPLNGKWHRGSSHLDNSIPHTMGIWHWEGYCSFRCHPSVLPSITGAWILRPSKSNLHTDLHRCFSFIMSVSALQLSWTFAINTK